MKKIIKKSPESKTMLSIPTHISASPLDAAIDLLMNNQVEVKTSSGVTLDYDVAALRMARSLFHRDRVYRFQGTRASTLTASGSGILGTGIGLSVANVLEVTPLRALFDEIRVFSTELRIQGYLTSTAGTDVFAFNPSVVEGTSVASYTVVARLPGSVLVNANSAHKEYVLIGRVPRGRPFAVITADADSGSTNPNGSWGAWWLYTVTSNVHTNSSVPYSFILKIGYELRARA